ncbi:YeeE/YedE family protein [Ramlibacter sp.]|uniref:YeeE/YedE family protein n=1 Tax=Ramlibacter sp. TaxID=1917967 RepID=UPI002CAFF98F|nr:YeeE/YedE family protein [Ramlibacter sp.]HWI82161.1 YeeE/YedE family protein [Ramlibacter sp.]
MKTPLDPATAVHYVTWGGLLLGLVLGAAGQASRFCVRGAIDDLLTLRRPGRLLSWLLAVAIAALFVQALVSLHLFDARKTIAWSANFVWASYLVGGAIFGFGMILAGGCPQRSLVKAGSGDLKSVVTLVVTAVAALMTLRGAFAPWRVDLLDRWSLPLATPQDLGSIAATALPLAPSTLRWVLVVAVLALAGAAAWRQRAQMDRGHWLGGLAVGLLVPAAFLLTGALGFVPEHPETLEPAWLGTQSHRPEGLSFVAPLANSLDLLTMWTDKATVATFGVLLVVGVLAGSFASARLRGDFRLQSFQDPRELARYLAGSVLMGFGGVTALGCSVGQGLTGLALLSAGALLAVAGIVGGAVLAIRLRRPAGVRTPAIGAREALQ